jgi:Mg2+/Co2+ transporter CorB
MTPSACCCVRAKPSDDREKEFTKVMLRAADEIYYVPEGAAQHAAGEIPAQ